MKRYGIGLQFQGMSMMITPYESVDGSWVKWEDIHDSYTNIILNTRKLK